MSFISRMFPAFSWQQTLLMNILQSVILLVIPLQRVIANTMDIQTQGDFPCYGCDLLNSMQSDQGFHDRQASILYK